MISSEAQELWRMLGEARGAAGPSEPGHEDEWAARALDMIPAPFGATYADGVLAGTPVLRVHPEDTAVRAPILWIHGGRATPLSVYLSRPWAGHLALELGQPVVIPDYRDAPEHAFPAALEEVVGVYRALVAAHPGEPLVVVGVSAGGALAVGAQLLLLAEGEVQPALTLLVCPWLDLSLTNRAISGNPACDVVQDASALRRHAAAYLDGAAPTHPFASPAHADVEGLGPLFIMAAEHDLLVDDSIHFARRCAAAGVDATLEITAGMPHCYQLLVTRTPEARAALSRMACRIRRRRG